MKNKFETNKSYDLRQEYIKNNKNKKNVEKLSRIYRNIVLLKCKYNLKLTKLVMN